MTIFQNPIDPPEIVQGWIDNRAHHGKGKEIPVFYQVMETRFQFCRGYGRGYRKGSSFSEENL